MSRPKPRGDVHPLKKRAARFFYFNMNGAAYREISGELSGKYAGLPTNVLSFFCPTVLSFGEEDRSGKERSSLADRNRSDEEIIVTFNGKDHTLEEWTKKQAAVRKQDKTPLNWRKVFADQVPVTRRDQREAAAGFSANRNFKGRRPGRFLAPLLIKFFGVPFVAAVIVGLAIGFTVLIMLSSHDKKIRNPSVATAGQVAGETPGKKVKADAPQLDLTVHAVQANTFSTAEGANEQVQTLKNLGVPAAVVRDGQRYDVFIALAGSESGRKKLVAKYESLKPFGKTWAVRFPAAGLSEATARYLETGRILLLDLIRLSADKALDQKVDQKALADVQTTLNGWTAAANVKMADNLKEDLTSFKGAIESAYSHIENREDQDAGQQSLLDAVRLYQTIAFALEK